MNYMIAVIIVIHCEEVMSNSMRSNCNTKPPRGRNERSSLGRAVQIVIIVIVDADHINCLGDKGFHDPQ